MKIVLSIFLFIGVLSSCITEKNALNIPSKSSIEIDYPDFELFRATIQNKSNNDLNISVLSKDSNQLVRSFGLGNKANAEVLVEAPNKLVIQNESDEPIAIRLEVSEESEVIVEPLRAYVSFILKNTSGKSIPLVIPSVMNPNLSPYSTSGVDLKLGQEILFRVKGRNYILLTVDETIRNGDEIDVASLLKKRKEELGLD